MPQKISFKVALTTKYIKDIKNSLAALKDIRSKEVKQLNFETDLLNGWELYSKYQKGKLYRSIDERLKFLKNLNRKICVLQTNLPRILAMLEYVKASEKK